jgi:hypothetical protein
MEVVNGVNQAKEKTLLTIAPMVANGQPASASTVSAVAYGLLAGVAAALIVIAYVLVCIVKRLVDAMKAAISQLVGTLFVLMLVTFILAVPMFPGGETSGPSWGTPAGSVGSGDRVD